MKKHLFIRVSEYGYQNPDGFTYADLINAGVIFGTLEHAIIEKHFDHAFYKGVHKPESSLDTMLVMIKQGQSYKEGSIFILTSEAYFNYFDYLELQEARKASRSAMGWAIAAIMINIIAIVIQIYTSQSTKIDEVQFREIKELIQNRK